MLPRAPNSPNRAGCRKSGPETSPVSLEPPLVIAVSICLRQPHLVVFCPSFMLNRPSELPQTDAQTQTFAKDTPKSKSQHGLHGYPILLNVPVETLTGITSYLNPPSLFSLAQVNRYLNEHVKDDNTWRRAFVQQILGIGPESNLDDEKTLLLRRSERSWRHEFIARYVLIR